MSVLPKSTPVVNGGQRCSGPAHRLSCDEGCGLPWRCGAGGELYPKEHGMRDVREDDRRPKSVRYSLTWRGGDGTTCSAEGRGLDISPSGVGLECSREIPLDAIVQVKASDSSVMGRCFVAHCTHSGLSYHIGLEFSEKPKKQ